MRMEICTGMCVDICTDMCVIGHTNRHGYTHMHSCVRGQKVGTSDFMGGGAANFSARKASDCLGDMSMRISTHTSLYMSTHTPD